MCGIAGVLNLGTPQISPAHIVSMSKAIRHRGPDDEGYLLVNSRLGHVVSCGGLDMDPRLNLPLIDSFRDQSFDLVFGFRRLAILDPSPSGHQPMASTDGRYYLIFNGEIYNYLELRTELAGNGHEFKTATDTEVILAAYQQWGPDCLTRFNGMWAFALWDNDRRQLFCSRDRFGIKPFYYYWDGQTFAFASEIKALLQLPQIVPCPNDRIIYDYVSYGQVDHTAETFFDGIKQLLPAHYLSLDQNQLDIQRYWNLDPFRQTLLNGHSDNYPEQFFALFEDAIRIHLRSDVAIGTCLSGGLDSSAIVCVANNLLFGDQVVKPELVGKQQKTFSSCFEDQRFDERYYIEQVLAATGAEANYTFPKGEDIPDIISGLIWHQDEPFVSTSIYAQWHVMQKAAERNVKVLLDGQGGDELLAGYHGYFNYYWAALLKKQRWGELWQEVSAYQDLYGVSLAWIALRTLRYYMPDAILTGMERVRRGGDLGLSRDFAQKQAHRQMGEIRHYPDPFTNHLYSLLTQTSLPALLRYEDRNSMAFSIEARVPFLDYRLVEYLFSLPSAQKIRQGMTKVVLRESLRGILPETIRMRTDKMGYVTPERVWLNAELKDWIRGIVNSGSFRSRGYFDVPQILAALDAHATGKRDLTSLAWRWINLELWFREFIDQR